MKRKCLILAAALAALLVIPAAASAEAGKWEWLKNGVLIAENKPTPIVVWGNIKLKATSGVTGEITCKTSGVGFVENVGGSGELSTFKAKEGGSWLISNCETFTICPAPETAYAEIVEGAGRVDAVIGGLNSVGKLTPFMLLNVECFNGSGTRTHRYEYEGSLELEVENGTLIGANPSQIRWSGKVKSSIEVSSEAELSGSLKFQGFGNEELITEKDPPGVRHSRRHHHRHHRHT